MAVPEQRGELTGGELTRFDCIAVDCDLPLLTCTKLIDVDQPTPASWVA